jgi:hypothetical protein
LLENTYTNSVDIKTIGLLNFFGSGNVCFTEMQ